MLSTTRQKVMPRLLPSTTEGWEAVSKDTGKVPCCVHGSSRCLTGILLRVLLLFTDRSSSLCLSCFAFPPCKFHVFCDAWYAARCAMTSEIATGSTASGDQADPALMLSSARPVWRLNAVLRRYTKHLLVWRSAKGTKAGRRPTIVSLSPLPLPPVVTVIGRYS